MSKWNRWIDLGLDVAQAVATVNPMASLVITGIRAVVDKSNDGISDKSVGDVIYEMSKSSWNSLTPDKVKRIIEIINEPVKA